MKELKDRIEQMTSDNYIDRFKAEYEQVKIKYGKLAAFIARIEAACEVTSDYYLTSFSVTFE